jgi:ribosomal protein S18 acetylase RimI-like enzyme
MMNHYTIRKARPTEQDAAALRLAEQHSLGDSDYASAEVLQVLRRPEQHTYLAVSDGNGEVAGFCSCIETPAAGGALRLEIDMLGVIAAHRRQGVARRLVGRAMDEAVERGVRACRSVVAVGNVASQGVFRSAGFVAGSAPLRMVTYDILGLHPVEFLPAGWRLQAVGEGVIPAPDGDTPFEAGGAGRWVHRLEGADGRLQALSEVLEVHTLAYYGMWVERLWVASDVALGVMFRGLIERAKTLDMDMVSRMWPTDGDAGALDVLLRAGYQVVGEYWGLEATR